MSQHLPRQQGANGQPIRLIVGLGNPGTKYERTRHNAGFWFVDEVARKLGLRWSYESKYDAEVARGKWPNGEDFWLMKPQTFMNLSGKSVQPLMSFFRITPQELLVAHDELDIPAATAKMKLGGGTGGHNGLEDIAERLGTKDYWRLRLGIGHPGHKDLVTGYVLGNAPRNEQELLDAMVDKTLGLTPYLEKAKVQDGLTWLHTAFAPPKPPKPPKPPRLNEGGGDDKQPLVSAASSAPPQSTEQP